jgi:hypothetical protein
LIARDLLAQRTLQGWGYCVYSGTGREFNNVVEHDDFFLMGLSIAEIVKKGRYAYEIEVKVVVM